MKRISYCSFKNLLYTLIIDVLGPLPYLYLTRGVEQGQGFCGVCTFQRIHSKRYIQIGV